ncbi:MAG TPA: sodium:proton antiporter NhaD [Patescibacteria group bacterium]|nr:sodium:proton antiporter NhaD [Patescibacteria group bacterium]
MSIFATIALLPLLVLLPSPAAAATAAHDFTQHWAGYACLALFGAAYTLVILEENIHLKKSKPVMLFAGLIWILVAFAFGQAGFGEETALLLRHNLLEFSELMLFLMAAMAYINTLDERGIFSALRSKLVGARLSMPAIYWITGALAFFISPVADNLTTALVMGAVVLAIGQTERVFVIVACINVVVAANAGGAFSPFGDITTLMVWQKGLVEFHEFFALFIPALVSWLIPAVAMSFVVPRARPPASGSAESVKQGGFVVLALFLVTIGQTVALHHLLHLPPFLGMMTGLGMLKVYGFFLEKRERRDWVAPALPEQDGYKLASKPFDIFVSLKRVDWDTLLFFYGVMLCVGGLGAMGYLALMSDLLYGDLGATWANVLIGLLSAVVDNIPIMFAVLSMEPDISHNQWLLVTLTAGIGGSLLSVGSAAGVALMGQARGVYTFFSHLKWSWAIALGYAAGIGAHIWLNGLD